MVGPPGNGRLFLFMKHRILPFTDEHLADVIVLFREAYARERLSSPLLPTVPMGSWGTVAQKMATGRSGPAVAAFCDGRMVGYLCTSAQFPWKGQRASVCREYAHAAAGEDQDRGMVYRLMYAALAEEWVAAKSHLHILCHFAGDPILHEAVYLLGFGAVIAENLRDLAPVAQVSGGEIAEETDPSVIAALDAQHARYYRASPIFLPKSEGELPSAAGNALYVCRERGKPAAYFIVGPCGGVGEGMLLGGTRTAQIASAFVRPESRGTGVGAALLDRCVRWARERGYERIFVEHETANIPGGAFWRRHFAPYLYASMRYVDSTL